MPEVSRVPYGLTLGEVSRCFQSNYISCVLFKCASLLHKLITTSEEVLFTVN